MSSQHHRLDPELGFDAQALVAFLQPFLHTSPPFDTSAAPQRFLFVQRTRVVDTLTPIALYDRIRATHPVHFLLESLQGGERWGRYCMLGAGAVFEVRAHARGLDISTPDTHAQLPLQDPPRDPSHLLEAVLQHSLLHAPDMPADHVHGGAIGTMSYDFVRLFEPSVGAPDPNTTLARFVIPKHLLRYDRLKQTITLLVAVDVQPLLQCLRNAPEDLCIQRAQDILQHARALLDATEQTLISPPQHTRPLVSPIEPKLLRPKPKPISSQLPDGVETTLQHDQFTTAVDRCKEYIRAGDIIQVVLSQRIRAPLSKTVLAPETQTTPLDLYRRLRLINPSPYLFLLDFGDEQLIGSSPEVLVRKRGRTVEVRPIAGTRRRGATLEEDQELARDLLQDPKERAEHIMLLDLGRNDIGRVSVPGTVRIPEQLVIERYSHVLHLVSHVSGTLQDHLTWRDALASTFPAGTLSGAPKVRAMQIIDELEPEHRGVYGGAVGFLGADGDMDLCIAIRTLHIHDGAVDVQVGAGIVADSDPESEWQETLNKAAAVLSALMLETE